MWAHWLERVRLVTHLKVTILAFNYFILLWSRDATSLMHDSFVGVKRSRPLIVTTHDFDFSRKLIFNEVNERL